MGRVKQPIVVLALDQAAASGWCVRDGVQPVVWGLAKTCEDRRQAVIQARNVATVCNARLLVFYEDHSSIPASRKRNTATILGMGDARGRWMEQLDMAGHMRSWVVGISPDEWRQRTIGTYGTTEQIKQRAVAYANSLLVGRGRVDDHNVAEAIVMAHYAAFDGVANFLGKRVRA